MRRTVCLIFASVALIAPAAVSGPSPKLFDPAVEAAETACPANAKKANLNFTLTDLNGKPVKLSDYQGKVLLLDFWATWCAPCKVEIPAFIDLYKTYKPRGFEIVGVVVLEDFVKAKPFVQQNGINYTVLNGVDREDIEDAFGPLFALPTSLVIARDGRICARHVGMPPMEKKGQEPTVADVKTFFGNAIKPLL